MAVSEPSPRWGHFSTPISGQLYVLGGRTEDFKGNGEVAATVNIYQPYTESWDEQRLKGRPLSWLYGGACASTGHHLYLYGGTDGSHKKGSLYQINTKSLVCSEVVISNAALGPMRKWGCGMVTCDDDHLLCIGGCGIPSSPTQPGPEFINDTRFSDGSGRTNEHHSFHLNEGTWSSPTTSGTRPPPCANFSITKVDEDNAVLFGGLGIGRGDVATNHIYNINLKRMHWRNLEHHVGEPCPVERSGHATVCLGYGGDHPQLLVTGGRGAGYKILKDAWILDMQSEKWREVKVPSLQSRCTHSATAFNLSPGLIEVILFGGYSEWPSNLKSAADITPIANTTVLRFEYQQCPSPGGSLTGEWVLTDVADSTQLGTRERIRDKMEKLSQATLTSAAKVGGAIDGGVAQESERRVEEAERRAREAERGKELAETRQQEAEREKEIVETRRQEAEREKEIVETRRQEAERVAMARQQELEEEARVSRDRATRAERRLALIEQRSREREEQLQQLETQWVVERREIQLTGPELGRGGWATVSVATFRGARVAAKCVHNAIISRHNVQLFRREMDMASRIRHPNLLQFIGATNVGEMVILTELMPTSLRRELEIEFFPPRLTTSIGLDVARALNYLHLMQPHPFIHRDISSANVLLEPLPNHQHYSHWRAKVSDYGTVNLSEQLQTGCPGSPAYSAPEVDSPNQQSTKMDIFSFGALLLEMLTGELPVSEQRARLLCMVHHQPLLALIQRCLSERREDRPNASDIISELN